jgi:hypothetical protein
MFYLNCPGIKQFADLSSTWISENLDPIVNQYIHKWLEIPISATLSNIYLTQYLHARQPGSVKY